MGFLKKNNAPHELPDLAIESLSGEGVKKESVPAVQNQPLNVSQQINPQPPATPAVVASTPKEKPIAGEDYLEFSHNDVSAGLAHDDVKKVIDKVGDDKLSKNSFFDNVLEDINSGIADVEKLEEWYEKKFVGEDVVSNMKGYWEGNKADIIIQSFGAEYKRQINDKVSVLRELEEDWREIYFRLVKKEEEMKKEERELKETVSEFVNLCKKRNNHDETEKSEEKKE